MSGEPRVAWADAGGVRLHRLEWGEGADAVLLVPGGGQSAHVFRALAPRLAAAGWRVVAVTPRGHGESTTPADGWTVDAFAADLRRVMDAAGIERAAVVAHSLGAAAAARLAADHPDRVSGLILLDGVTDYAGRDAVLAANPHPPPPYPLFGARAEQRAWMSRHTPGFWCEALEADLAAHPALAEEARRLEGLAVLVGDAMAHPLPAIHLRCPVLVLFAGESVESQFPWLDAGDAEGRRRAERYLREVRDPWRRGAIGRFAREAPDARVMEVPGGHWFFLSDPGRVADEILSFLAPPSFPDS